MLSRVFHFPTPTQVSESGLRTHGSPEADSSTRSKCVSCLKLPNVAYPIFDSLCHVTFTEVEVKARISTEHGVIHNSNGDSNDNGDENDDNDNDDNDGDSGNSGGETDAEMEGDCEAEISWLEDTTATSGPFCSTPKYAPLNHTRIVSKQLASATRSES
ncbi:hypothetical protein E4U21_001715 [Claviceps maximensis]|nr:hypothetical protein E4U21_001715 [Claviceps maximensis]